MEEDNSKWGCSISIAELAFIMLLWQKLFGDADVEWWIVFVPLIVGLVYDIVELITKRRK